MKTISLHSYKGGVSKTTLSLNLAGSLTDKGYKVILIDIDEQGSATFLAKPDEADSAENASHYPFQVCKNQIEIEEGVFINALTCTLEEWQLVQEALASQDIDFLICDFPPGIPGIHISSRQDLVLVPFRPCLIDFEAARRGMESLKEHEIVVPVLTQVDRRSPNHKVFIETVNEEFGEAPLMVRCPAFEAANNDKHTVYDMPKSGYRMREARQIIDTITDHILEKLEV